MAPKRRLLAFNAEYNSLYIYFLGGGHKKAKICRVRKKGASRDSFHEAVHNPEINHLKNAALTFSKAAGCILTHNRLRVCTLYNYEEHYLLL